MTTIRHLPAVFLGLLFIGIGQDVLGQNPNDRSLRQGTQPSMVQPGSPMPLSVARPRSVHEGTQPVRVAFANQTAEPVTALWIDFNGMSQEAGTIPPGQIVELETFPGHLTVFSARGRQLSSFRASASSHGAAYGIVEPGGAVDPSKPRIAVCWAPPPGMGSHPGGNAGTPGGPSAPPPVATVNNLRSLIQTLLTGATSPPPVPDASTPSNERRYTGLYRGKQSTFNLTWERADGSGNVRGMMITEGDMASSFSGGESSPGLLEVEVSADLTPINHKLRKVIQGGKISWVGDYITLTEVN